MNTTTIAPPSGGGPFKLYLFDERGQYDPAEVKRFGTSCELFNAHFTRIRETIQAKRKVIIEDRDGFAVFHAEDGRVLFPVIAPEPDVERGQSTVEYLLLLLLIIGLSILLITAIGNSVALGMKRTAGQVIVIEAPKKEAGRPE